MRGAEWLLALGGTVREEAETSRHSRTVVARVRVGWRLHEGTVTVHDEDLLVDRGGFVSERIDDMLFKVARSAHGWKSQGKTPSWYAARKLKDTHFEDWFRRPWRARGVQFKTAAGRHVVREPRSELAASAWEAAMQARRIPQWDMRPTSGDIPKGPGWFRLCEGAWRTA